MGRGRFFKKAKGFKITEYKNDIYFSTPKNGFLGGGKVQVEENSANLGRSFDCPI
jgi:hypothetical protein